MSSNAIEGSDDFDVDEVMRGIDGAIMQIESELKANDELDRIIAQ